MIPTDVGGLVAWHRAQSAAASFGQGSPVDSMADSSGNGWTAIGSEVAVFPTVVAGRRPIMAQRQGKAVLRFNGLFHQMLTAAAVPSFSVATLYVVSAKRSGLRGNPNRGIFARHGAFLHLLGHVETVNPGRYSIFNGTSLPGREWLLDEFVLLEAVFNGASSSLRRNLEAAVTGDAGSSTPTGNIILGAEIDGFNYSDIDFGESAYYNGVPTDAQRQGLLDYFAHEWPLGSSRGARQRASGLA